MAIQYTTSEGVSIGYSISSEGEETVIFVPGVYSNLAFDRYFPKAVAWENFLGRFGRVVTFDKRATGVSDRSARPLNLDQQVVDVESVRVASNSKDLIVCGLSQGAPLAVLYALAYPERVRALILLEGVCCDAKDPYASLSDDNTLFDWEHSLADI
jgi:pimeloyl-ACP methyl ester carboxylesterase